MSSTVKQNWSLPEVDTFIFAKISSWFRGRLYEIYGKDAKLLYVKGIVKVADENKLEALISFPERIQTHWMKMENVFLASGHLEVTYRYTCLLISSFWYCFFSNHHFCHAGMHARKRGAFPNIRIERATV